MYQTPREYTQGKKQSAGVGHLEGGKEIKTVSLPILYPLVAGGMIVRTSWRARCWLPPNEISTRSAIIFLRLFYGRKIVRTCLRCILVVLDCLEEIAIAVGIKNI